MVPHTEFHLMKTFHPLQSNLLWQAFYIAGKIGASTESTLRIQLRGGIQYHDIKL